MDSLGPDDAKQTRSDNSDIFASKTKQSTPSSQDDEDNSRTALLGSKTRNQEPKARLLPVVLSVLVVSFGCFIHGTSVVYGGIAVVGLDTASRTLKPNSNETELGFEWDNTKDSAWLVGIASIGMIIGSLLAAPISNKVGRKITCIVGIGVIFALAYTIFVFPVNIGLLYISRLMMGLGLGVSQSISTIYIAEVSTLDTRASLAVIPAMTGCLGVVSCQVLAKFLDYRELAIVYAAISIPFIIMVLFIPESPVFLLSRKKLEETHRVLRRLRGPQWDVVSEAMDIKRSIDGEDDSPKPSLSKQFLNIEIVKPLVIAFSLMFFFQTSGINLMLTYAPVVFGQVTDINQFTANIYLGAALFASNTLTLVVASKCPRRIMLLISSLGCSITLAVMGVSYHLKDREEQCRNSSSSESPDLNCSYNLDWLPVLNSMIFIFVFNLGYGSMVWMTVVEILPAHIRNLTNGLTVSWVGLLSFITTYSFPFLLNSSLAGAGAFWLYSAISFVGFLFIAIFVPETRGKTDREIKQYFANSKESASKSDE